MDKQLTDTGETVVDMEVIREMVKLKDYIRQHNYCIKELTEMVMQLDERLKKQGDALTTWYDLAMHQDQRIKQLQHNTEELKLDNTGLWREFAELHTRVTKK